MPKKWLLGLMAATLVGCTLYSLTRPIQARYPVETSAPVVTTSTMYTPSPTLPPTLTPTLYSPTATLRSATPTQISLCPDGGKYEPIFSKTTKELLVHLCRYNDPELGEVIIYVIAREDYTTPLPLAPGAYMKGDGVVQNAQGTGTNFDITMYLGNDCQRAPRYPDDVSVIGPYKQAGQTYRLFFSGPDDFLNSPGEQNRKFRDYVARQFDGPLKYLYELY
ncbi:MAG: hypothetical protein AB1567_03140, partial [bacterium]